MVIRVDVSGSNMGLFQPASQRLGYKLRAVVTAKVLGYATRADHDLLQLDDHPLGREAPGCFEQQAFPGVFTQDGVDPYGLNIGRAVLIEVVAPDLSGMTRASPQGHAPPLAALTPSARVADGSAPPGLRLITSPCSRRTRGHEFLLHQKLR